MRAGIYIISNAITAEVYVGSAVNCYKRWKQHQRALKSRKHHSSKLQAAWVKHGHTAFDFHIVETVTDIELLQIREQHWIDHYDSHRRGYNSTPIASRPFTLTDAQRDSIAFDKYYGIHEPKYVKKIKNRPLQYDQEAQARWEVRQSELMALKQRQLVIAWVFFAGIVIVAWLIKPASLILVVPIGAFASLFVAGRHDGAVYDHEKAEPQRPAREAQEEEIKDAKRQRRRPRWRSYGFRYMRNR